MTRVSYYFESNELPPVQESARKVSTYYMKSILKKEFPYLEYSKYDCFVMSGERCMFEGKGKKIKFSGLSWTLSEEYTIQKHDEINIREVVGYMRDGNLY